MINKKYLKEFIDKEIKKYLNEKDEITQDLNGVLKKYDSYNEDFLVSNLSNCYDTSNKEIKIKVSNINFDQIEVTADSSEKISMLSTLNELSSILSKKLLKKEFVYVDSFAILKLIDYKKENKSIEKLNNSKFKKIFFEINYNLEDRIENKTLEESLKILNNNIILSNKNIIEKNLFDNELNKIKKMNDFDYINRHFQGFRIEINDISYKELKDMFGDLTIKFNKNTKLYFKSFIKPNIEYIESKYNFSIFKEFITIKFIL